MIKVNNVSYNIGKYEILKNIHLHVEKGERVALVGPNGSGKSTLIKTIAKLLIPQSGTIEVKGVDIDKLNNRDLSKKVSYLSQFSDINFDFTVEEIVEMGLFARNTTFNNSHKEKTVNSLKKVGMEDFLQRSFSTLSGGEKQRVLIARAFAQENDIFILDEPINHLDIRHQLEILEILKEEGVTLFSSIHDLNLSAMFFDKIILVYKGEVVSVGTPKEVFTEENILNYFGVLSDVYYNEATRELNIMYKGTPKGS